MTDKGEAVAQKKDEHENRNAVIVGFLLALLPIIIFVWAWYNPEPYVTCDGEQPCPPQDVPPNSSFPAGALCLYNGYLPNGSYAACVVCKACVLPSRADNIYALLKPFYELIYLPLGVLLYVLSRLGLSDGTRSKLRFAGKSFFAGGVIGILLYLLIPSILTNF